VAESRLPPGNEIRFREPTAWEQYRWQVTLIAAALTLQTALIIGLLYEHRRRRSAEAIARNRVSELAQMDRAATAGELSATIAHEISQPLGAIVANASAGLRWLSKETPDLDEVRNTLNRIVRDGRRQCSRRISRKAPR
jgi:C4-dicarboxylate-specific signal transduction histidine kinase